MVDPGEGDLGLLRGGGHSEQFNSWKGQLYYLYIRLLVGYSVLHNFLKGREVTLPYPIGAVLTSGILDLMLVELLIPSRAWREARYLSMAGRVWFQWLISSSTRTPRSTAAKRKES